MVENLYMLPSDMNLKIRSGELPGTMINFLISDGNFSLGKNDEINLMVPAIKSHETNSLESTTIKSHSNTTQGLTHAPTISHEDEKTALIQFSHWWFFWFLFR